MLAIAATAFDADAAEADRLDAIAPYIRLQKSSLPLVYGYGQYLAGY